MVFETIKRNPIPTAMAGVGLAMLWRNRSEQTSDTPYYHPGLPSTSHFNGQKQGLGSKVSDAASTVGEGVGGAVSSIADGAQEATGEVVDRAGATAQQVGWKLDNFMQASPLAMGAIAVGAGAVVGSLIPETDPEREILGDASRQVGTTVRDTLDDATSKADEAIDKAGRQTAPPSA